MSLATSAGAASETRTAAASFSADVSHHYDNRQTRAAGESTAQVHEDDVDDTVLRDVLEELDRERSRRAELELQLRKLTEAVASAKQQRQAKAPPLSSKVVEQVDGTSADNGAGSVKKITQREYIAMQTKVWEFGAIVEALTQNKPAIVAAPAGKARVMRLLEVLPWTPQAQEHVVCKDHIYEWNYYDLEKQVWNSQLRVFPPFFKNLPVVRPEQGNNHHEKQHQLQDRGLLVFLAGKTAVSISNKEQQAVFTDETMKCIFSMEQGYPLPDDGGSWEWIGGWRIEKRVVVDHSSSSTKKNFIDCDSDGWSYAQEPEYFTINPTEWVWDNPGKQKTTPAPDGRGGTSIDYERKLRRRKWIRLRVLVDYPYAREATKEYLKLAAENARLKVVSQKISDQLVATKVASTESEETLLQARSESRAQIAELLAEIQQTREKIHQQRQQNQPKDNVNDHGRIATTDNP